MMSFSLKNSARSRVRPALILSTVLVVSLLGGCSEFKKSEANIDQQKIEADQALAQIMPKSPISRELSIDSRPYYGSHAVPITNGDALPTQFEQGNSIVMTFARPVTLTEFTRMLQSVTGLRTNTAGDLAATSGNDSTGATFIPSDGEQVSGGRIVWQGRLSDLLNDAADVFKADWRYDGTALTFSQQVTRTFMLHALAGELSLSGSVKSGSGGGSSSDLPQVDVTSTSGLKIWEDIKEAVKTIMGDKGSAAYSQATGTITVTSTPEVVRRVESYLNQQNAMRLRRVAVAVKVLNITLSNTVELGTDVTGAIRRAFGEAGFTVAPAATGGSAFSILKDKGLGGNTPVLNADRLIAELRLQKGIERASVTHSGALMTLSDQPAPLQVGRQISYLARTSSTSGDSGSGSVSLEPDTVNTGLMITVLPRIVEQNRILMRLSVAITDLASLESFGPDDGNQIQLPEVETTGFLQNAVMTSGETLVLAGFEKDQNNNDITGAPGPLWLLKGDTNSARSRQVTVLLLTSEILPEEPMTVIGN